MNFIENIKTGIDNRNAFSKLEWMLEPYRNVTLSVTGDENNEKMFLYGNGRYGLDVEEVKQAVNQIGNKGNRVNIFVFNDGNEDDICGSVSILKKR